MVMPAWGKGVVQLPTRGNIGREIELGDDDWATGETKSLLPKVILVGDK